MQIAFSDEEFWVPTVLQQSRFMLQLVTLFNLNFFWVGFNKRKWFLSYGVFC